MAIDSVGFLKSSRKPIADLFLLKLVRLCFIKVWELNERHFPVQCPACRLNPIPGRELGGLLFR